MYVQNYFAGSVLSAFKCLFFTNPNVLNSVFIRVFRI